jgi:hypothetical protein
MAGLPTNLPDALAIDAVGGAYETILIILSTSGFTLPYPDTAPPEVQVRVGHFFIITNTPGGSFLLGHKWPPIAWPFKLNSKTSPIQKFSQISFFNSRCQIGYDPGHPIVGRRKVVD